MVGKHLIIYPHHQGTSATRVPFQSQNTVESTLFILLGAPAPILPPHGGWISPFVILSIIE